MHTLELTRMQYKGLTLDIEHIPFDLTSLGSLRVLRVHSQDMLTETTLEALLGAKACGTRAALTELDLSGQHAVAPALFDSFLSSGALMHLNLLRLRSTALEVWMPVCVLLAAGVSASAGLALSHSLHPQHPASFPRPLHACVYACMHACMHAYKCTHTHTQRVPAMGLDGMAELTELDLSDNNLVDVPRDLLHLLSRLEVQSNGTMHTYDTPSRDLGSIGTDLQMLHTHGGHICACLRKYA